MTGEGVGRGSAGVSRSTRRDVTWPSRRSDLRLRHLQRKGGGPRGPPGARNAGRLGYRVPPAAISRDLIASPACDCWGVLLLLP
jgi:hypothetical protein